MTVFSSTISTASIVVIAFVAVSVSLSGCRSDQEPLIKSYLSGSISLSDSTLDSGDNSGFQILVLSPEEGRIDTLANATTDNAGNFSVTVRASEAGIYPIVVRRSGGILKTGQLVVSNGDSAVVSLTLPADRRPMIIRSLENGAWLAYRNAKAGYSRTIADLAIAGTANTANVERTVLQSAGMMWKIASVYPNTIGADLAAVESLMMLGSVANPANDSTIIERAAQVSPANPSYVDAGRVAWRATARAHGLDQAVTLLNGMRDRVQSSVQKGALQSEIVIAYQDSSRFDEARQAANKILAAHNDTDWGSWAESAIYELDYLRPGQPAPKLDAMDRDGRLVQLSAITTPWIVLEFYDPRSEIYQRELASRSAFQESEAGETVTFISVSLESDEDVNEAFLERGLKGIHIVARDGFSDDLAKKYNVNRLPKRFLIRDGFIVGKYSGQALTDLLIDLAEQPV